MTRRSRFLRRATASVVAGVLLLTHLAESRGNTSLLPHAEQLAPGVHVAGFADRYQSVNCGWVVLGDHTLLVGLPYREWMRPSSSPRWCGRQANPPAGWSVARSSPAMPGSVKSLLDQGITRVLTSPALRERLLAAPDKVPAEAIQAVTARAAVGDARTPVDFLPLDGIRQVRVQLPCTCRKGRYCSPGLSW